MNSHWQDHVIARSDSICANPLRTHPAARRSSFAPDRVCLCCSDDPWCVPTTKKRHHKRECVRVRYQWVLRGGRLFWLHESASISVRVCVCVRVRGFCGANLLAARMFASISYSPYPFMYAFPKCQPLFKCLSVESYSCVYDRFVLLC